MGYETFHTLTIRNAATMECIDGAEAEAIIAVPGRLYLAHWCDRHGQKIEIETERGMMHYREETTSYEEEEQAL